ncbi:MAG: autotransporter outer membrane beta-barrel domain-containing protein [Allosphingosinicella sp.]
MRAAGTEATARRALLLLGTSLVVHAILPTAAMAQNECGLAPPGGGTVTCQPSGNPYPGGIDYDPPAGVVVDLTVVLQPGVVVANNGTPTHPNGIEIGSSTAGVDLSLQGATQTSISTDAVSHDAVDVVATDGTVTIALDDVDTAQDNSRGVVASGRGSTSVTVDTVATLGENSDGISAEEGNFVLGGTPSVVAGTSVTANSVSTAGSNSTGLIAFSENGDVLVDVGTVTTGGDSSTAVLAIAAVGDVRVTSDTVTTSGANSVGIDAQIFPFPDEVVVGTIVVDSGTVDTTGDNADGIVATSPVSDVSIISDSVVTRGDDAQGIGAFITGQFVGPDTYSYGDGDIVIDSGSITTEGSYSDGIVAVGADDVTITSDSISTAGDASGGIDAAAYFAGDIVIDSGTVATLGDTLPGAYGGAHGIDARADQGSINITSTSVTTAGERAVGITAQTGEDTRSPNPPPPPPTLAAAGGIVIAAAPVALPPDISITSGSVSTQGDGAGGILAQTAAGDIFIESGSVATTGNTILGQPGVIASGAHGIEAVSDSGSITIDSTSITTAGTNANGIVAETASGLIGITSGTVTAADGRGIEATSVDGDINIESGSITTVGGLFSDGIFAETASGDVIIDSGTVSVGNGVGLFVINESGHTTITSDEVTVTGDFSPGIAAYGDYYVGGDIAVISGSVETTGTFSNGIDVESRGAVSVRSTSIVTEGDRSRGIEANSDAGGVTIDSGTIATSGLDSRGIQSNVYNEAGIVIESGTITTLGDNGDGIVVATLGDNSTGDFEISSTSISTQGDRSTGIYAYHAGSGDIVVTSGTVTTAGDTQDVAYGGSHGIELHANSGSITVASTTVGTQGAGAGGILASTNSGAINITSGTVTTAGADAIGIAAATGPGSTDPELPEDLTVIVIAAAPVAAPPDISITSGSVTTAGANAPAIFAATFDGDIYIESGSVQTSGAASTGILAGTKYGAITVDSGTIATSGVDADGINATVTGGVADKYSGGAILITSDSVTTTGDDSEGINAASGSDITISSGVVNTTGDNSPAILASGATVTVTSGTVTTAGDDSAGILVTAHGNAVDGGGGGDALTATPPATDLIAAALGPAGGASVTSGSVTTTGDDSPGISVHALGGDAEVISTGTVTTGGANSDGIVATADVGSATVDAAAVNVTGAGSDAIVITSATTSAVTIRGLVRSGQGLALDAVGGPATVTVVAGGTLRGRVDLTDNADSLANSGTFDAIGTSQFGAGSDLFGNAAGATVRSVNGAAIFAGLEAFNNSGLVEMRDGAVGDSLNISGAYTGQAGSTLGLDVDFTAGTADRLIVGGAATGGTTINVQGSGSLFGFNPGGILVVDAGAGTQAGAFTLAGATSNPYVSTSLRFDAAAFDFLIVSGPNQPVFETVKVGEIVSSLWYKSADAVDAQLQASRDGHEESPGNALRGESGAGIWVQAMTGQTNREATQSFTVGGTSASFDLSYEEQFQGLQGGVEIGAGPLRLGVTGGFGDGDAVFDVTGNRVEFDVKNIGAYAQLRSGGLWANGLVKMDWIDLTTQPGAGLSAKFDARSFGAMLNLGYRAELGLFFVEPSAGIAWVKTDIDSYQSGGATVDFDDAESLRAQAGLRVGAELGVGESATLTPYVGVRAFDELRDGNTNRFTLGATLPLADDSPGTHGRAEAGFSLRTGNLEAFVRGELDFAGDTEGKSIRGGIRLRF